MARNIEIKARAGDFPRQVRLAAGLADGEEQLLVQEDTFFEAPTGRLKLRELGDGTGVLIQYHRPDTTGPSESQYILSETLDPASLKEALGNALGIRAVVKKRRTVRMVGRTRIHLDEVEGLGEYLELEVVLEPGEANEDGVAVAEELMAKLEIAPEDLVEPAYVDLLEEKTAPTAAP